MDSCELYSVVAASPDVFPGPGPDRGPAPGFDPAPAPDPDPVPLPPSDPDPGFPIDPLPTPAPVFLAATLGPVDLLQLC
jgi:hypothetical protein